MDDMQPYVKILIQPQPRSQRFRYECEGRFAGCILGDGSARGHKTFPTIQVINYIGPAIVIVSCVTKDPPHFPHPHKLVGKDGCERGICTASINNANMLFSLPYVGIQCMKRKDIAASLRERERIEVDPFETGFKHSKTASSIDLTTVRLCFQVFIQNPESDSCSVPLAPIVSDPIYDKKAYFTDLTIYKLSHTSACVVGGTEVILLCDKITREDIEVLFYDDSGWEATGEFGQNDVHKQVAISFRTPRYHTLGIREPVCVRVQLRRISDDCTSESKRFWFLPVDKESPCVQLDLHSESTPHGDHVNNRHPHHKIARPVPFSPETMGFGASSPETMGLGTLSPVGEVLDLQSPDNVRLDSTTPEYKTLSYPEFEIKPWLNPHREAIRFPRTDNQELGSADPENPEIGSSKNQAMESSELRIQNVQSLNPEHLNSENQPEIFDHSENPEKGSLDLKIQFVQSLNTECIDIKLCLDDIKIENENNEMGASDSECIDTNPCLDNVKDPKEVNIVSVDDENAQCLENHQTNSGGLQVEHLNTECLQIQQSKAESMEVEEFNSGCTVEIPRQFESAYKKFIDSSRLKVLRDQTVDEFKKQVIRSKSVLHETPGLKGEKLNQKQQSTHTGILKHSDSVNLNSPSLRRISKKVLKSRGVLGQTSNSASYLQNISYPQQMKLKSQPQSKLNLKQSYHVKPLKHDTNYKGILKHSSKSGSSESLLGRLEGIVKQSMSHPKRFKLRAKATEEILNDSDLIKLNSQPLDIALVESRNLKQMSNGENRVFSEGIEESSTLEKVTNVTAPSDRITFHSEMLKRNMERGKFEYRRNMEAATGSKRPWPNKSEDLSSGTKLRDERRRLIQTFEKHLDWLDELRLAATGGERKNIEALIQTNRRAMAMGMQQLSS